MAQLTTIARPYAKAVFAHATETQTESKWDAFLAKAQVLINDSELAELLKHQGVEASTKVQILRDLLVDVAVDGSDEFLETLGHYGRLLAVPEIASEYEQLLAEGQKALEVTIKSAYPLSDNELELLESKLRSKYATSTVRIQTAVDATLIGGFEIRSSDTVIDASVKGRLEKIAESLAI
jgi:F-type H+-transporting ATPase subunit delta